MSILWGATAPCGEDFINFFLHKTVSQVRSKRQAVVLWIQVLAVPQKKTHFLGEYTQGYLSS